MKSSAYKIDRFEVLHFVLSPHRVKKKDIMYHIILIVWKNNMCYLEETFSGTRLLMKYVVVFIEKIWHHNSGFQAEVLQKVHIVHMVMGAVVFKSNIKQILNQIFKGCVMQFVSFLEMLPLNTWLRRHLSDFFIMKFPFSILQLVSTVSFTITLILKCKFVSMWLAHQRTNWA